MDDREIKRIVHFIPHLKGARRDGTVLVVIKRERPVEKSTNIATDAKLMLNTLWGEFGHPMNMTGTWQRRDMMRWQKT